MARFWIADLHLGHEKVAKMRGFDTVGEHDQELLSQITKLNSGDQLWVLGDISSGKPDEERKALEQLGDVSVWGRLDLHLIAGNHDSVSSIHRNGYKKQREFLETFDTVQQFGRIRLCGKQVLMSHYPYARSGDGPGRGKARYLEYRLPDTGLPLIHGHTHHTEPHMKGGADLGYRNDTSQFCVSWDAHRRLVTEGDLNDWLA